MALEINTSLYSMKGIDTANVAKISSEILGNSQNAQVQGLNLSKFNRATLGIDLYSNRTNADLQKQIALTQAGLYAQAVNVAKLNSQAALNLYSAQTVQRNVELTQSTLTNELTSPLRLEELDRSIRLFETQDKHSNASNGYNPFRANQENKDEK